MNREGYGNYVKGATLAKAGIALPGGLIGMDYLYTSIRDGDKFDVENWKVDGLYITRGYIDMITGRIK
jgi:hypothetical protein